MTPCIPGSASVCVSQRNVCCFQAGLYGALTRLHQADVFIADDECGEQISCLQVSAQVAIDTSSTTHEHVMIPTATLLRVDNTLLSAACLAQTLYLQQCHALVQLGSHIRDMLGAHGKSDSYASVTISGSRCRKQPRSWRLHASRAPAG